MSSQMMNSGSSNGSNSGSSSGFRVLYDKTYSNTVHGNSNSATVGFYIGNIPNYERLTKDNIFCGITTANASGTENISITEVEYLGPETPQIYVHLSATGSGGITVYVNCKVIG